MAETITRKIKTVTFKVTSAQLIAISRKLNTNREALHDTALEIILFAGICPKKDTAQRLAELDHCNRPWRIQILSADHSIRILRLTQKPDTAILRPKAKFSHYSVFTATTKGAGAWDSLALGHATQRVTPTTIHFGSPYQRVQCKLARDVTSATFVTLAHT